MKCVHTVGMTETSSCSVTPYLLPASSAPRTDQPSLWRNSPTASLGGPWSHTREDKEKETLGSKDRGQFCKKNHRRAVISKCLSPRLSPTVTECHCQGRVLRDSTKLMFCMGGRSQANRSTYSTSAKTASAEAVRGREGEQHLSPAAASSQRSAKATLRGSFPSPMTLF